MKRRTPRWLRWQRGQALMEYWPTIPAGIILMLSAGALVQFISGSILSTVDYLNPSGFVCEDGPEEEEKLEGPELATLGDHTVRLVSRTYDEENDRTTIVYRVTNGGDPAISNWLLGLPASVRGRIQKVSESYLIEPSDPHYGFGGVKFETGYGGGKGKKSQLGPQGYGLIGYSYGTSDSRNVLVTLGGYFEWGLVEVGLKAGTETYHNGTITAPISLREPEDGECDL